MAQPAAESRLSMATPTRVPVASALGFVVGASLGLVRGSSTAALRFRAEHAHHVPTTTTGWFMYHKSKNYHSMAGGLREGARMGARMGLWTLVAFGLESTIDRCRGTADMLSTVMASLTVAGSFSIVNRFSAPTAARTARQGLLFGIVFGGIQDAVSFLRGRPVSYVEFFRRRFGKDAKSSETTSI